MEPELKLCDKCLIAINRYATAAMTERNHERAMGGTAATVRSLNEAIARIEKRLDATGGQHNTP